MKKTNKILLLLTFLAGTGNFACTSPKQTSSSENLESKTENNVMAKIDEMGKNWTSHYAAVRTEDRTQQYFDERIRPKVSYDETKMRFNFCDGIPISNLKAQEIIDVSEKIPDQLQDLLNYERIKVNIHINGGAYFGGREIDVSLHHPAPDLLHEIGHAIDRFTSLCTTKDYDVFFDIFEKCKNLVPEYYRKNEEFFAYIFEEYYNNPKRLKESMPEAYAFFRKFEVLNVERSLTRDYRNRTAEKNYRKLL